MDHYSSETWMLDRHREMATRVEARMRNRGWRSQARLAELLAVRLRLLADRLDGTERPAEGRLRVLRREIR